MTVQTPVVYIWAQDHSILSSCLFFPRCCSEGEVVSTPSQTPSLRLFPIPWISLKPALLPTSSLSKAQRVYPDPFHFHCLSITRRSLHFQDKKRARHPPERQGTQMPICHPGSAVRKIPFTPLDEFPSLVPAEKRGLLPQQRHIHTAKLKVPQGLPDTQKHKLQVQFWWLTLLY